MSEASGKKRPIPLMLPNDLISVAGIAPEAAQRLAPYIVVLDERTPINANTARPEVIAARVPGLSLSDARTLVAERERISYFNNIGEVRTRLGPKANGVQDADIATASALFLRPRRGQTRPRGNAYGSARPSRRVRPGDPAGDCALDPRNLIER